MGLTLRDGVYHARTLLGEHIPEYWYTQDVINHLNWAAQDMCSEAQCLETLFQTTYPSGTEEVALPTWVDEILGVAVFSGQLFQLSAIDDWSDVQVANRVSGIPVSFYTKMGTTMMSPQGTPANITGDITPVVILAAPEQADFRTVLGLWPIPSSSMSTTVWCTRFHRYMQNPQDPVMVPSRFADGWSAYAIARGKEKESMLDEAQYYDGKYQAAKMAMRDYFIGRKQSKTAPSYGGSSMPLFARGSSSVVFLDQQPGLYNM